MADDRLPVQQAVYQYPWRMFPRRHFLPLVKLHLSKIHRYNQMPSAFSDALPWCIPAHAGLEFSNLLNLTGCGRSIHRKAVCLHKSLLTHHHRSLFPLRYLPEAFFPDEVSLLPRSSSDQCQVHRPQRKE